MPQARCSSPTSRTATSSSLSLGLKVLVHRFLLSGRSTLCPVDAYLYCGHIFRLMVVHVVRSVWACRMYGRVSRGPNCLVPLLWSLCAAKGPFRGQKCGIDGPFSLERDQSRRTRVKGPSGKIGALGCRGMAKGAGRWSAVGRCWIGKRRRRWAGPVGHSGPASGVTRLEDPENRFHRAHQVRAAGIGGGLTLALRDEVGQVDVGLDVVIVNLRVAL